VAPRAGAGAQGVEGAHRGILSGWTRGDTAPRGHVTRSVGKRPRLGADRGGHPCHARGVTPYPCHETVRGSPGDRRQPVPRRKKPPPSEAEAHDRGGMTLALSALSASLGFQGCSLLSRESRFCRVHFSAPARLRTILAAACERRRPCRT